jgi:1,4-alpha-glucan branching enzyme
VQCYLPLLQTLRSLVQRGILPRITISFSPVLCEQLASGLLREELQLFLDARLRACTETATYFRHARQEDLAALTDYWAKFYRDAVEQLQALGGDILGAFRGLAEQGAIEAITSAATHGYLPLLGSDESIRLQLRLAVLTHESHFGHRPRGVWLPEGAYRPRYHWIPPVGLNREQRRALRHGLEELVAESGLTFFFADSHLILGGRPLPLYEDYFPHLAELRATGREDLPQRLGASLYKIYRVSSRGGQGTAAVFFREPETALQVWSRERGYPGDPWYLDFHKKHLPGGLKLWRVSDKGDLAAKAAYVPDQARGRAQEHARHFASLLARLLHGYRQTADTPGLVCSLYDAELFGHWWYEGPQWLGFLWPELERHGVEPVSCSTYLERCPPTETITLPEGSWGEGGDHRTWLNRDTMWTWERLYDCEFEFWTVVREHPDAAHTPLGRVLCQAARALLFMQASDWPFLITSWTARDYAEQRFAAHYADFRHLMELARQLRDRNQLEQDDWSYLASKEQQEPLFPKLEQVLFREHGGA